jgi:signal peptidase I
VAQTGLATPAPPRPPQQRKLGRAVLLTLFGVALALLAASIAVPVMTLRPVVVPRITADDSMENTVLPGDRLFVVLGDHVRRGDVVVISAPVDGVRELLVRRVIGLPGDHVACCDSAGRVTVNGKPLDETYLYPGDEPSGIRFSVTLGPGQVWLMGDHRGLSFDSRQGGPAQQSRIMGHVLFVQRGSEFIVLRTPRTYVSDGLAPVDRRPDLYLFLLVLGAGCVAALLILAVIVLAGLAVRRRRWAPPANARMAGS